jgi:hypothetical protein
MKKWRLWQDEVNPVKYRDDLLPDQACSRFLLPPPSFAAARKSHPPRWFAVYGLGAGKPLQ